MIQIKGSKCKANDKNSYLLLTIFTPKSLFTPQNGKLWGKKNPGSTCLLPHVLPWKEKQHIWSVNWGEGTEHVRVSRPFCFFPNKFECRVHTFLSCFMCRLFFPAGSLQLDGLVWLHSTLVEGINKPIMSKVQNYLLIHLYKWLADFLIFHLHYFYIYFSVDFTLRWGKARSD